MSQGFYFWQRFPWAPSVRLNWVYLIRHIQTIKGTVFEIDSDMYKWLKTEENRKYTLQSLLKRRFASRFTRLDLLCASCRVLECFLYNII